MSAPGKIVVIGGGLAGITAAIALSEVGADVTLAEARPRLGGATTSFSRGGLMVDNGQHVFLRCCTEYRGLVIVPRQVGHLIVAGALVGLDGLGGPPVQCRHLGGGHVRGDGIANEQVNETESTWKAR